MAALRPLNSIVGRQMTTELSFETKGLRRPVLESPGTASWQTFVRDRLTLGPTQLCFGNWQVSYGEIEDAEFVSHSSSGGATLTFSDGAYNYIFNIPKSQRELSLPFAAAHSVQEIGSSKRVLFAMVAIVALMAVAALVRAIVGV
jgi:hypothetical protein